MSDTPAPAAPVSAPVVDTSPTPVETPAPKTWELKKGDKVKTVTDESELIRLANKGYGADSLFEEIAQGRKQLEDFHANLKADPKGTIKALAKQIGVDAWTLSEEMLEEFINAENTPPKPELTPQEKELEDFRADKKRRDDEEAAQAQTAEEQQFVQEKAEASTHYLDSIQSALDSVGFIKSETLRDQAVEDAAGYLIQAYDANYEPDLQDIADHIKMKHMDRITDLLSVEDDSVMEFLPPEFLKRVGKYWFNRSNTTTQPFTQPSTTHTAPKSDNKPKKMSQIRRERSK